MAPLEALAAEQPLALLAMAVVLLLCLLGGAPPCQAVCVSLLATTPLPGLH